MRTTIISRASSKFGPIRLGTAELAALELLKKIPYTYNGENLVSTLAHSFLIGSSSFLPVIEFEFRQNSAADFGVSCP